MAMKAMLRALAGEEPELPPREPGKRSRERLAAEMVWIWWALKAGCTKRAIMLKLGISKSTCKRRLRAIRQELAWQLGDGKDEDALAIEWEARLAILRSGQVPPPLTPKRELQLMELAESVVSFYAPDLYDPAPESPERGSGRRDLA